MERLCILSCRPRARVSESSSLEVSQFPIGEQMRRLTHALLSFRSLICHLAADSTCSVGSWSDRSEVNASEQPSPPSSPPFFHRNTFFVLPQHNALRKEPPSNFLISSLLILQRCLHHRPFGGVREVLNLNFRCVAPFCPRLAWPRVNTQRKAASFEHETFYFPICYRALGLETSPLWFGMVERQQSSSGCALGERFSKQSYKAQPATEHDIYESKPLPEPA